ncbi:MAG: hypothetical protein ACREPA_09765 [Candidatus Dormibacteraceae bacterium]
MTHLGRAIALVNAAADGAGDEEVTPAEIAREIRLALASARRRALNESATQLVAALDALADGMPCDHVAGLLYAALARSRVTSGGARPPG